jgi:hypothetical protein
MRSPRQWEIIANYESFELIKRAYETRHGRTPGTRHAREIAAPFSHARSYFRSAVDAELTVKPLLLYYGVVSLSRGITLFMSRGLRESALTPSHGLSVRDWSASLNREKPDFGTLRMSVTAGGSLIDLARATGNRSLLRANSSAVNYRAECPPLTTGSEFTLADLLSREPALQEHQLRWTNQTNCAPLTGLQSDDPPSDSVTIKLPKKANPPVDRALADRIFQGTQYQLSGEDDDAFCYRGPNSVAALPALTDRANPNFLGIGDIWITASMTNGLRLSKINALFSLSYALGMLVRYFPTQWTALVRGQIDDAALPTLAAAVEFIEANFPSIVVDFLNEESV